MQKLIAFLIALQIIDAVTTYIALKNPKLRESNKLILWLMGRVGLLPALVIFKGALIVLLVLAAAFVPDGVVAALCMFYCWVIWNNVRAIDRTK